MHVRGLVALVPSLVADAIPRRKSQENAPFYLFTVMRPAKRPEPRIIYASGATNANTASSLNIPHLASERNFRDGLHLYQYQDIKRFEKKLYYLWT